VVMRTWFLRWRAAHERVGEVPSTPAPSES
jgi:hypothetical protein